LLERISRRGSRPSHSSGCFFPGLKILRYPDSVSQAPRKPYAYLEKGRTGCIPAAPLLSANDMGKIRLAGPATFKAIAITDGWLEEFLSAAGGRISSLVEDGDARGVHGPGHLPLAAPDSPAASFYRRRDEWEWVLADRKDAATISLAWKKEFRVAARRASVSFSAGKVPGAAFFRKYPESPTWLHKKCCGPSGGGGPRFRLRRTSAEYAAQKSGRSPGPRVPLPRPGEMNGLIGMGVFRRNLRRAAPAQRKIWAQFDPCGGRWQTNSHRAASCRAFELVDYDADGCRGKSFSSAPRVPGPCLK